MHKRSLLTSVSLLYEQVAVIVSEVTFEQLVKVLIFCVDRFSIDALKILSRVEKRALLSLLLDVAALIYIVSLYY